MTTLTAAVPNYRNPALWDARDGDGRTYGATGEPVVQLTTNEPFVVDGQAYVWQTDLTIGHGGSRLNLMAKDGDNLRLAGYVKTSRTGEVAYLSSPQWMDIAAALTQAFTRAAETGWQDEYIVRHSRATLTFVPLAPSIPHASGVR